MRRVLIVIAQMKIADTNVCKWLKVRHLPELWPTWYEATDQMQGTYVFGNSADDTSPWGIEFGSLFYDMVMFTTNNLEHWTCLDKSLFTIGVWYNNS